MLVGGAAINRRFGWRILYAADGEPYEAGVFYCKDAFEGLSTMDALMDPKKRDALLAELHEQAAHEQDRAAQPKRPARGPGGRSNIEPAERIPSPPGWGPRIVSDMPLEIIFQHLFKNELFRLSWGAKNAHGAEWEQLEREFEMRLQRMQKEALRSGWLQPQAVYGYWPAQAAGEDLILYRPESLAGGAPETLLRFSFPRQPHGDQVCLADYFAPAGSGRMDVVAFQVVTVGQQATERFDRLQAAGDYSEAYFTHGLAVQTAEATAEYLHRHIRRELGLAENRGKRYSWGYPAIPNLEDHRKVFELLPAASALGMSLTSAYQLIPEQSTAAIVVHHPEAKYFSVGESRVEQLLKT
ncbi:MAG TPA: vitamin B12 dependent-methionine synthase activation domain-containing protein [Anaerolineales bacterium]|nr:vitamin B12 dependent-methionine synthase activation domain-containing protein [Anaerolineales bacterium]